MGLSDIWHELQFFWIDITSYTEAERQVDKYEKIIKDLERKIKNCSEELEDVKRIGTELHSQFTIHQNCAYGELKDFFDSKEGIWEERREEVIAKAENALSTARACLQDANMSLSYWESQVVLEERQLRDELWNRKEEERENEREQEN
jgi:DNA-binding transcriptional regulator GbsR (MarR family)